MGILTFIQYLTMAYPPLFSWFDNHYPHYICIVQACIAQFFTVASGSWNFVLVILLFTIIHYKKPLHVINEKMKYFHIFVWYVLIFNVTVTFVIVL